MGLVPGTHMAAYNVNPVPGHLVPFTDLPGY